MIYTRNPEHCKSYLLKCLLKYVVVFLFIAAFCFFLHVVFVAFAFLVVVYGLLVLFSVRSLKNMYLTLEIELTDEYIERRCAGFDVRIPFSELFAVVPLQTFADGESIKVCGKDLVAIGIPHDIAQYDYIKEKLLQHASADMKQVLAFRRFRITFSVLYFITMVLLSVLSVYLKNYQLLVASFVMLALCSVMRTVVALKSAVRPSLKITRLVTTLIVIGYLAVKILAFIREYYR